MSALGRAAVAALTILPAGCAALPVPITSGAGAGGPAGSVEITITEIPSDDLWQVGYVLPREAAGVEFVRARTPIRYQRWGVGLHEGEAEWRLDGDRERLCFSQPARTFSVGFRTSTEALPKDYELNAVFSDGGRLLYTGHLLVRPLARCDEEGESPEPEHRFTLSTAEGRSIRALDAAGTGSLRWIPADPDRAHTYVYFGGLEPVESATATVLLDPGLPAWMRDEMAAAVPALVDRFAAATGTALPFRPLLLVAWGGAEGSGSSFSGGSLPGLLLVSASGPGWLEPDDTLRREWFHRLAHEIFHLWDGETFRPDDESEWLSEAAADHFAVEAALAEGYMEPAAAERWRVERVNDCIVRLGGRSLRQAGGGSDYDAWYSCGAVVMAAADGALRRVDPPTDAAHLFRRLFQHAAATGSYGAAPFVAGLRELGADPAAVDDLRRLIGTGPGERADLFLQRLLAHAGISTDLVPPEEAAVEPATLREIVRRAVGRCWCGDQAADDCDPVETGKTATTVAGHDLRRDPHTAWQALTTALARRSALTATLDDLDTTLFCGPESLDPTWQGLLAPAGTGGS